MKTIYIIVAGMVFLSAGLAMALNPYVEMPSDPAALQAKGIEIRYSRFKEVYRFIVEVTVSRQASESNTVTRLEVSDPAGSGRPDGRGDPCLLELLEFY